MDSVYSLRYWALTWRNVAFQDYLLSCWTTNQRAEVVKIIKIAFAFAFYHANNSHVKNLLFAGVLSNRMQICCCEKETTFILFGSRSIFQNFWTANQHMSQPWWLCGEDAMSIFMKFFIKLFSSVSVTNSSCGWCKEPWSFLLFLTHPVCERLKEVRLSFTVDM